MPLKLTGTRTKRSFPVVAKTQGRARGATFSPFFFFFWFVSIFVVIGHSEIQQGGTGASFKF